MSEQPDTPSTVDGQNRRALLRAGLGAVAMGAWVAPQVLFPSPASAACTPLPKYLQLNPAACAPGEQVTTIPVSPQPATCVPSSWAIGHADGVTHTCVSTSLGGTVTITRAGCTVGQARAVKYCPNASGAKYSCVNGTVAGSVVTFAPITGPNPQGCSYLTYRISLSCC